MPRGRPRKNPLTPIQPNDPDYNHQFTQGELRTYDFRGWDIRRLPFTVEKAARAGIAPGWSVIDDVECVGCKHMVWAVDPERENLCEACDFYLRNQIWDLRKERAQRNNMKAINPFAESEDREILFNPFKDES